MLSTQQLKNDLRDAVNNHFLVSINEAEDTDKVIYHSQILVDKITHLTGYHPQKQNVAEYGMPQDTDEERTQKMPFDAKIAGKVEEFKRLLEKQQKLVQPKIDSLKQKRVLLEQTFLEINETTGDETLDSASQ